MSSTLSLTWLSSSPHGAFVTHLLAALWVCGQVYDGECFGSSAAGKAALTDLTVNFYHGEITTLLGQCNDVVSSMSLCVGCDGNRCLFEGVWLLFQAIFQSLQALF